MEKNWLFDKSKATTAYTKLLIVMKLTVLLVILNVMQVSAHVTAQDKVTLRVEKMAINQILNTIENQGYFRFVYNSNLRELKQKTSINVKDASIIEVLKNVLDGTDLLYNVLNDNLIVIRQSDVVRDITVKGKVMDSNGTPLSGVSVTIKGADKGVTTDANGDFSISVPEKSTLVFSFVGFQNQEVPVTSQDDLTIILNPSASQQLSEVVVIGYGTASKRDLTGSIVKVDGKDIVDKPNTNPVASLQAKVAGLSVVNNGTPGKAPDIRIRGTVSIGQVHPLYVVDGIFNDNIDYLNPNDIESIEVLKDPSSLAIFGVRGATGVIAITTKKAKAGKTIITFNTSYGFKQLTDKIKLANADEFKMLFEEERTNDNDGVPLPPYNYGGLNSNTDWIDAVTRTARFNTSNLSITGSSEKNKFNFGLGYTGDEGIVRHEKLEKLQLSFGDEYKINNFIKIGANINMVRQKNPYDATTVLDEARKVMPQVSAGTRQYKVRDLYGSSTDSIMATLYSGLDVGLQNSGVVNPLVRLENEWNKVKNVEYRSVGSVFAEINFLKNFTFRSTFYADISTVNKRQYTPLYYNYDPLGDTAVIVNRTTRVQETDQTYRKWQQDHVLTYKNNFGDHGVTLTGGFTTYYYGFFERFASASKALTENGGPVIPDDPRFWYVTSGFEDPDSKGATSKQTEYTTVSYLARLLYNYKGTYFLNASFRDDASSRIPAKNRHQKFWAVGAAWEITNEKFMANQKFLDFLKLKGSIGVLGNQTAIKNDGTTFIDYPFYPNLIPGSNAVFGTNVYSAAALDYLPNPDLKWETVHAKEIGLELNAFSNRLHFEANYFIRTTKDLMTYVDRSEIGLKNKLVNGGSLKNWGQEFSASWNQTFSKDLVLNVGGNITFLKNKVLSLSEDLPTGFLSRRFQNNGTAESRTMVGMPIGFFYGYVVEGIYQTYADILTSPNAASVGAYRPGDFKFKDIAGPGGKGGPDGLITADDKTMIGNPTPKFTYGASVNVTYKGFSLSVDMGGVYGNQIFRTWGSLESPFQRVNYSGDKVDRWHGAGTSNWVPLVSQGDRFNYNGSTYNIEDGSYFRLRNIQLAYNIPAGIINAAKINSLRFFVNCQNFKTWKNNYGYTPEYGGDATAFGYDNAGGAIPIVTTFGLNVTF